MQAKDFIRNARTLMRISELGVLSTHSKASEGYPFGSVSTYITTVQGNSVFYISDLAQHTKNILHDPKMCLTVFSGTDTTHAEQKDPNAGARLSILGEASRISDSDAEEVSQRFFALYPESQSYQKTHDFAFYQLSCHRVRFIGGFGDIHWISKNDWLLPTPEWETGEASMITHMNEDHVDAMQLIYQHQFGVFTEHVSMLAINPDGCFLRAGTAKPAYIPFPEPALTGKAVRKELVELTNNAREALGRKAS